MAFLITILLALSPSVSLPDPDPLSKLNLNLNIDNMAKSHEQKMFKEYLDPGKVEEKQYNGRKNNEMAAKIKYHQRTRKESAAERPSHGRRAKIKTSEKQYYGRRGKEIARSCGRKAQQKEKLYYGKGGRKSGRSAQCTTILFESVAGAAEWRGRSLGYFDEISDLQDDLPVYHQRGGAHVLSHANGKWWVSEVQVGPLGWIRAESDEPLPPFTGWQFWDGDYWHDDDITLKATINPPEPDDVCNNVRVNSMGPAAEFQAKRMGLYRWEGEWLNGRKRYRNGNEYLRIYGEHDPFPSQWSIASTKPGSVKGGILSGRGTVCPCDPAAGPSRRLGWGWWRYSQHDDQDDQDFKPDKTITVTCE